MSAENYNEILEKVCKKLDKIDSASNVDVSAIKNSVESIENLLTDSQSKLNFQDIRNKLEKISLQVDTCNDSLLKDVYNDLNSLKGTITDVSKNLENLQNIQNLSLTSAEFEEFQKQQLDLALKTNENIYNELKIIKEKSSEISSPVNIKTLETQIDNLHATMKDYIEQIVNKIELVPGVEEIGSVVSDLNSVQQKSIKQTNVILKEIEVRLAQLKTSFENKDLDNQISKISEIYDSLGMINDWIEKVGYINQSIDNVYSRLGENIDFDDVADKIDIIYENITALNNWTVKIDSFDGSFSGIQSKLVNIESLIQDTKNISNTINLIKNRVDEQKSNNIDCDFEDLSNKMDIVYENLSALNQWANKIDIVSDKVNSNSELINDTSEKMGEVSLEINNITGHVEDVSEQIKDVSENINTVSQNINNISENINTVYDHISEVSENISDVSVHISSVSGHIDEVSENVGKVCGNLGDFSEHISEVSEKIDNVSEQVSNVNDLLETESVFNKLDVIYENISLLNQWVGKIDELTNKSEQLDQKHTQTKEQLSFRMDEISETIEQALKISEDIPDMKDKLIKLSDELHKITSTTKTDADSYIYTLLDIESDFLKLNKIVDDSTKITSNDINSLKERFEELNDDISSISIRTNKLILSADDANKEFKTHLEAFKNTINELDIKRQEFNPELKFALLGEKINGITDLLQDTANASKNLNNAFLYLADWIDATGSLLNNMNADVSFMRNNNDYSIALKIIQNDVSSLSEKIENLSNSYSEYISNDIPVLKEAVSYLITKSDEIFEIIPKDNLESIDSLNTELASVRENTASAVNEVSSIKENISKLSDKMNEIELSVSNLKTDDISEIKSSLTGIMVQLNTALTPDIDSLNDRIDKLCEEQNHKMSELETLLNEKVTLQEEKINSLENKLDSLTSKFEKLSGVLCETDYDEEIKSILNYVVTQLSAINDNIANQQSFGKTIKSLDEKVSKLEEKVSGFDGNINKIVSYIDE